MPENNTFVSVIILVLETTTRAIKFAKGKDGEWLAKSQFLHGVEWKHKDRIQITIPETLAIEKGLA